MAETTCPSCRGTTDDTELFCPRCGAALIPQMTRTQMQSMADHDVGHAGMFRGLGCVSGLVLGLVLVSVAYFGSDPGPRNLALQALGYIPLLAGLAGMIGGHLMSILILRVRRKKYRRGWRRSHNRD